MSYAIRHGEPHENHLDRRPATTWENGGYACQWPE